MAFQLRWRDVQLLMPCLLALGPIACAPQGVAGEPAGDAPSEVVACRDPRPEVCIQVYDPVCACTTADCAGGTQSTRSNDCVACRDPQVAAYRPGPCEGGS